ncbi:hypothetical protein NG791_20085 [Laspinema sp. D1]|uniref:hypothetical protein n=1 Tax=Laspinema palackyanum TaxID=3231601 RepID=UPI003471EB8F|nr:hypothetical protein [Laspinema sp. D2b]
MINLQHFDNKLNDWIYINAEGESPEILTESLENTMLEAIFPEAPEGTFSIGEIQNSTTPEDLEKHPNKHKLLLASGKRLVYGPQDYKQALDRILPDEKDKAAYASLFIGSCLDTLNSRQVRILIVEDDRESPQAGENGGILPNSVALAQVGDSHGKISPTLARSWEALDAKLQNGPRIDGQPDEIIRHVVQHRAFFPDFPGEAKIAKGTLAPKSLDEFDPSQQQPLDLILPRSSFKGGTTKPAVGLYEVSMWMGVKSISEWTLTSTAEAGLERDTLRTLEKKAAFLSVESSDPRKVAQLYCETYEKAQAARLVNAITEEKQNVSSQDSEPSSTEQTFYKILKAELAGGHSQLLESKYVRDKLDEFLRSSRLEIATGGAIKWDRASIIIPSKNLNDDQVCIPKFDYGNEILGFRSPLLYEDAIAIQTNTFTTDLLDPEGRPLVGVAVVSDESYPEYLARTIEEITQRSVISFETLRDRPTIAPDENLRDYALRLFAEEFIKSEAQTQFQKELAALQSSERTQLETQLQQHLHKLENTLKHQTYSQAAGEDYDGDSKSFALAASYLKTTAYLKQQQHPHNAHPPTPKLKKASFVESDGSPSPLTKIALHMANHWVGIANNQVKAARCVEEEVEVLRDYGSIQEQQGYLRQISYHYQNLLQIDRQAVQAIERLPEDLRPDIESFAALPLIVPPEQVKEELERYRQFIRFKVVPPLLIQNQIAVDSKKSATPMDENVVRQYGNLVHRVPSYLREKKYPDIYKSGRVIKTNGYSLKELNIQNVNSHFQRTQLEARPIEQFRDLFPDKTPTGEPTFSPSQKLRALQAKTEFDRLFNYAKEQDMKRRSELGPVLRCQTGGGKELDITNITEANHPLAFQANEFEVLFVPNKQRHTYPHHQVLALAKTGETLENGKPKWAVLGTLSESDRKAYQMGAETVEAKLKVLERKPGISERQCQLLFERATTMASAWREQAKEQGELFAMAAATWHLCTTPDNRSASEKDPCEYKIQHFVFAAFPDEIAEQCKSLQFRQLMVTGIQGVEAIPTGEISLKIDCDRQLPPDDPYSGQRILFATNETGHYERVGALNVKEAQLPVGTEARGICNPGGCYTATLKIEGLPEPISLGKINENDFAHVPLTGQTLPLQLQSLPSSSYLVKTEQGQLIGELDSDSVACLNEAGVLSRRFAFSASLQTLGKEQGTYSLASTAKGNTIAIRKQNTIRGGAFKNHRFSGQTLRLVIEEQRTQQIAAVVPDANGSKVLGIFTPNTKTSKIALQKTFGTNPPGASDAQLKQAFERGALENLTLEAQVWGKISTLCVTIDPTSIRYPDIWMSPQTPEPKNSTHPRDRLEENLLNTLTTPVIPHYLESDSSPNQQLYGLTVDAHKIEQVRNFLDQQQIPYYQVDPSSPEMFLETERGYAVLRAFEGDVPESIKQKISQKYGEPLNANLTDLATISPYHQYLESTPPLESKEVLQVRSVLEKSATSQPSLSAEFPHQTIASGIAPLTAANPTAQTGPSPQQAIASSIAPLTATNPPSQTNPVPKEAIATNSPSQTNPVPKEAVASGIAPLTATNTNPEPQKSDPSAQEATVEEVRNWYRAAHQLGKPEPYLKRIAEIGQSVKQGHPLSEAAATAMHQDIHKFVEQSWRSSNSSRESTR